MMVVCLILFFQSALQAAVTHNQGDSALRCILFTAPLQWPPLLILPNNDEREESHLSSQRCPLGQVREGARRTSSRHASRACERRHAAGI